MNIQLQSGALTEDQLRKVIIEHNAKRYRDNLRYMEGKNPTILHREFKDVTAPHSNIAVPYARKIIKTVAGYMYRPGLIQPVSEDEQYLKALKDVYWENNEDTKTAQIGEQVSLQGVGYEVHYMDGTLPRFVRVPAPGAVPIYSQALEPDLVAFVRTIERSKERVDIEIYYADRVDYLHYNTSQMPLSQFQGALDRIKFKFDASAPHEYEAVPVVVFKNNDEEVGDIEPALGLIDAYDRVVSDSINEFDRFAWAYLVLKGMGVSKEDAEDIKQKRILEIMSEFGDVKFLTKDVPHEFIQFMAELLRKEIHKQTHVPDFADDAVAGSGLSGVAMDRMMYDFENLCVSKEMFFKDALYDRVRLLNTVMGKVGYPTADPKEIDFVFNRNKVTSYEELGKAMQFYAGHVSEQTLIEQFAPFVKDPRAEMEAVTEEKKSNAEAFGLGLMDEPEDDATESE